MFSTLTSSTIIPSIASPYIQVGLVESWVLEPLPGASNNFKENISETFVIYYLSTILVEKYKCFFRNV
jgi:hypothetical protein